MYRRLYFSLETLLVVVLKNCYICCEYHDYMYTRSNKDPQTNSKHCSRFLCSGSETRLEDCQYSSAEVVDGEYGALVCSTEAKGWSTWLSSNSLCSLLKGLPNSVFIVFATDDSTLKMNVSILVIMIFTSLLLIAILLLVLRCIVRNFKKKSLPSNRNQISGRTDRSHRTEISRIQLDQDMPYYTSVATVAPPSYRDTLLADQSNPIPTETAVRQHGYIVCDNGDQDSVSLNSSDSFQLINDRLASNNSPNSWALVRDMSLFMWLNLQIVNLWMQLDQW